MIIDQEIKVNSKKMLILTIVFFVFVVIVSIFFIMIPNTKLIKESSDQITKERVQLEASLNKIKNPEDLKNGVEKLELRINSMEDNFMNKGNELELIKILEDIALKNNIIQSISPENSKQDANLAFQAMNIRLSVSGNFKNIIDYIQDIETLKYYININSMSFTRSQSNSRFQSSGSLDIDQNQNISCMISAETYWK